MLSPKRTKFRKAHKGRIHGMSKGGTTINFGAYGLKATSPERMRTGDRPNQILQGGGRTSPVFPSSRVVPKGVVDVPGGGSL